MVYHKIQTVYKRDPNTNYRTLLMGEYSLPEFEYLKDNQWVFTEKVDGTNIRIVWDGETIRFGGKTDNAQIPAFLMNRLQELFPPDIFHAKKVFDFDVDDAYLYGEGYGAKIQKGGGNYKADGVDFALFDVRIGKWWLKGNDVEDIAKKLGLDTVPVIGTGSLDTMVRLAEEGFVSRWGEFTAEGIVARPSVELQTRSGHRIITKIKHKDFIQKNLP